jgi:hypothetical protein
MTGTVFSGSVLLQSNPQFSLLGPCQNCGQDEQQDVAVRYITNKHHEGGLCRACVLLPDVLIEDKRGDALEGPAREAYIDEVSAPLPDDHPVRLALEELLRRETESSEGFDLANLVTWWTRKGCLSVKQMSLIAWRLSRHNLDHNPALFAVSKESLQEQWDGLTEFKQGKLLPYLSMQQRLRLGIDE